MENLLGCANDLAPHYYQRLLYGGYFRIHPDSKLGLPGPFQGLNVGVLLLNLEKMRKSVSYNEYMTSKGIEQHVETYGFQNSLLGI